MKLVYNERKTGQTRLKSAAEVFNAELSLC